MSTGRLVGAIILVIILILSLPHRFWFGIFFPLIGLFMIFAEPLGFDAKGFNMWACAGVALLLSIGFSILFRRRRHDRWRGEWCYDGRERFHAYAAGAGAESPSSTSSNSAESMAGSVVRVDVNFGSVIKYINSDNLERVEAECNFGALKLYFDNAKPQASGALIVLDVNFSAVELFIPRTWAVNNELEHALSGVDEKNRPSENVEKTALVTIVGEVNLSGVSVIYI